MTKRSSMTFFSDGKSHYSQRVRIVLAEKGVAVDVLESDVNHIPAEIEGVNPYNELPILIDRELVLYEPNVMMEYLDERFPHPPLLPVYPVARAESRLYMYRIQRDWCTLVDTIVNGREGKKLENARKELRDGLVAISPLFEEKPYFMSDEFTIVDCCAAPVLWRLPALGVELPAEKVKPLNQYMERLFSREAFKASLSEAEAEMR